MKELHQPGINFDATLLVGGSINGEGRIVVSLVSKREGLDGATAAGEFQNELLGQAWRRQIARENRAMIEAITSRALGGAAGPPGLDELLAMDIGEGSAFEDPLGIAMSWEEKYTKKKKTTEEPASEEAPQAKAAEKGEGT